MNDTPLIVSFFTPGLYAQEAYRLYRSLERLGLGDRCSIVERPAFADWDQATRHKAICLREFLEKYGGPVLWLDADSVVWQDPLPHLLQLPGDIAVHRLGMEMISAVLWLRPEPVVFRVLDRWIALNAETLCWEQRNLECAITAEDAANRVHPLPPAWCWMVDNSERVYGPRPADVVIEQLQASRERFVAQRGEHVLGSRRRRIAEIEKQLTGQSVDSLTGRISDQSTNQPVNQSTNP